MTKTHLTLIVRLLERYADDRSNAGCNDLDDELFNDIDPRQVARLGKEFLEWVRRVDPEREFGQMQDYELIRFLAGEVLSAAQAGA